MVRREGSSMQYSVYQWVARRLVWAAGGTICTRRQTLRARLFLCGLALILAAGSWRPASILAQLPAGTPTYNANAKWVTDRGSQVYNVKAYGATGNGSTDDTSAINAAIAAAGAGGTILFPPGSYKVTSQLQLASSYQTLWAYGANLLCNLSSAASCIYIGTTAGPFYGYIGNRVYGLQLTAGPNMTGSAAIEDNGTDTTLKDIAGGDSSGYKFLHFVQDDNDQMGTIDHLYNMTGVITCNSTACGSMVYGSPGTGGIYYITNSNFSSNCGGNDIDWETGNHLTVSKSEFQAWSQYALRTNGSTAIDGWTHWEQGNCTNPLNDGNGHALGGAGLISLGTSVSVEGSGVGGVNGSVFSTNASGGTTTYAYYVVGHNGAYVTAPLLIGGLGNGGATVSSSAQNYLVWPALTATGVTTGDILRTNGTVPYGTGAYLVATVIMSSVCGANGVCAYTDSVGTPSSYTVAGETWYPGDNFWPGNLVLFGGGNGNNYQVGSYSGPAVASLLVNGAPSDGVEPHVVFTGTGNFWSGGAPTGPGFITGNHAYSAYGPAPAELFLRGVQYYNTKGWLNFLNGIYYAAPTALDYLTMQDSNVFKTLADPMKHPAWDAADTALCGDPPYASGACLRGPTVSQYIGVLPDGSHWTTRTTSTGIADAVPHYGFQTISSGAPNTPTLTDESSATTCQRSHFYALNAVCFDGTNFELAIWNNWQPTGAATPSWATTPGQTTVDGDITWECLGTGALAANTAYYFKTAGCTVGGCSTASSEATITTANDSASHMILLTGTAKAGHTSYKLGCSTSTGTEALLTAPWPGAYTGAGYLLPAMGCSGSGSFNTVDATGNMVSASGTVTQTIASGSLALATSSINSGTCQAVTAGTTNSAAAAGVVSTDTIIFTPNGSLSGVSGFVPSTSGGFSIAAYPTSGYVNFDVCNWTGSNAAPGSATVNWRVTR